jgi:hypothetical protein
VNDASWIADVSRPGVVSLQESLHPKLAVLEQRVADACPGRTGEVIDAAIRGVLGLTHTKVADLDPAESVVYDVAEQFVLDVHGVTDPQFARLKDHFAEPEIVAMLFRMALADGLGKLEKVA